MSLTLTTLWVTLVFLFPPSGRPAAAEETRTEKVFRGNIVTSTSPLTPSGDDEAFLEYLKHHDEKVIGRGDDGRWRVNLIAFLREKVGKSGCFVVLYDVSGKERTLVEHFPLTVEPSIQLLATTVVFEGQGIVPGRKYQLVVTRVEGGKEKVLASKDLSFR